jgi:ABC-type phosphate transport system substrate-binding protein
MDRPRALVVIGLALFAVVTAVLVVTSIPSSALDAAPAGPQQAGTPTPTPTDLSVAGSTGGIFWMGVVIAIIVLTPLFVRGAIWRSSS